MNGNSEKYLILIHEYLKDIMSLSSDEETAKIIEKYSALAEKDNAALSLIMNDCAVMAREIVNLRNNVSYGGNDRKLSALSLDERLELEETEKIINENRFDYYFQPIVSTRDGEIYSYEALMRPKSDMKLGPAHILKYAELVDRLSDIEKGTFLNVLGIIDDHKEAFCGRLVFINSIPEAKLNVEDFRAVSTLLLKHADTAVIEMTEQSEADDESLETIKERCRNMGIRIAVDDYGSGYSNVSNLLRYMPNYVKIDRSLLSEIQNSPKKRHFVREIIQFCHDNDILALAEGIETAEELHTVILLGADLIQGYFTSKPSPEIIDSIPYDVKNMIIRYRQEHEDGRDQQMYCADDHENIMLERLVKEEIKRIVIGSNGGGDVTVTGTQTLDTQLHIEIEKEFKGSLTLNNAWLSNVKNRPCIDIGEGSDVELILAGENILDMGGIRVPESAKLTVRGDGKLTINLDANEYYGIGNGIGLFHGDLYFEQSGRITINAQGQTGVCIGSGSGGNIFIEQGQYRFNIQGDVGLGIGSMYTDSKLVIHDCDIGMELTLARGAGIGSIGGNADITCYKTSVKNFLTGLELVGIGTVGGEKCSMFIHDASVIINIRGERCSAIAALEGSTNFRLERAALRIMAGGEQSLGIGGFTGDTSIAQETGDTHIKLDTPVNVRDFLDCKRVTPIIGRFVFTMNGEDVFENTGNNNDGH